MIILEFFRDKEILMSGERGALSRVLLRWGFPGWFFIQFMINQFVHRHIVFKCVCIVQQPGINRHSERKCPGRSPG